MSTLRIGKSSVSGFTDALVKSILVEIVNAMKIYNCPFTGKSYEQTIFNTTCSRTQRLQFEYFILIWLLQSALYINNEIDRHTTNPTWMPPILLYLAGYDLQMHSQLDALISCTTVLRPNHEELESDTFIQL